LFLGEIAVFVGMGGPGRAEWGADASAMIAGHLVYVRNHFGGLDPEKRPLDMPHIERPDSRVEASYALTAEEFALSLAELQKRYPRPEP